jgi:hypothetical protein
MSGDRRQRTEDKGQSTGCLSAKTEERLGLNWVCLALPPLILAQNWVCIGFELGLYWVCLALFCNYSKEAKFSYLLVK